jgi:hypothetical protein
LTPASSALRRCSASASGEPKRRCGAASAPWWVEHAVRQREAARVVEPRRGALLEHPQPDLDVAEQPPLVGEPISAPSVNSRVCRGRGRARR